VHLPARFILAALLLGFHVEFATAQDSGEQRALALESAAERLLSDNSPGSFRQAASLFGEAAALSPQRAAVLYERAGAAAAAAGDPQLAARHYGRALLRRSPDLERHVVALLETAPLAERGAPAAAQFLSDTRSLAEELGLSGLEALVGTMQTAAEAQAFVELLYAADRTTRITIRSTAGRMEVQVRPVYTYLYGGLPEVVRTDTTLVREPVGYDFCYLDPATGRAMRLQQSCRLGCVTELPSPSAIRTASCDPSSSPPAP
jgi:hypothetical protein